MNRGKTLAGQSVGKFAGIAFALILALTMLAACSGQSDDQSGNQPSAIDTSSWKTLGDALAVQTEPIASSCNDQYYVEVFSADDSYIRVVAQANADTEEKYGSVDFMSETYTQDLIDALGDLTLLSAEDITSELLSQDELDALVGKTGQELFDDGWAFESYVMYGGEETEAVLAYGNFDYGVTFGVTTAEDNIEDEGASIKDTACTQISYVGVSDAAIDPTQVKL